MHTGTIHTRPHTINQSFQMINESMVSLVSGFCSCDKLASLSLVGIDKADFQCSSSRQTLFSNRKIGVGRPLPS